MQYFVLREQYNGQFALTDEVLSGTAEQVFDACAAMTAEHNVRHAVWPYDAAMRPVIVAPVEVAEPVTASMEA